MNPTLSKFVESLDHAVISDSVETICANVRSVLVDFIEHHPDLLPQNFLKPSENHYARRLLHKCPDDLYSVVIMVWDQGQGTGLHDHSGSWCVEGVYKGKVRVESYEMIEDHGNGYCEFKYQEEIVQGAGKAGALIPPFEYHILSNPFEEVAITIHVYSGEMTSSLAFHPVDGGGHRSERKNLTYTK